MSRYLEYEELRGTTADLLTDYFHKMFQVETRQELANLDRETNDKMREMNRRCVAEFFVLKFLELFEKEIEEPASALLGILADQHKFALNGGYRTEKSNLEMLIVDSNFCNEATLLKTMSLWMSSNYYDEMAELLENILEDEDDR